MGSFSQREFGQSRKQIVDDAPLWVRTSLFNQVLRPVLSADLGAFSYGAYGQVPARPSIEKLSAWMERSPDPRYTQPGYAIEILEGLIKEIKWCYFYDFIEYVSQGLIEAKRVTKAQGQTNNGIPPISPSWPADVFQQKLNALFFDCCVGWRLDDTGLLQRTLPGEMTDLEESLFLLGPLNPANVNILKAKKLLSQRPCDAANSIKESISAIESVARDLVPGSTTLGDAVKSLRAHATYPMLILSAIEKLYAFASSEPGVRHGSTEHVRVSREDAEYVYVTSMATIRYLKEAGA